MSEPSIEEIVAQFEQHHAKEDDRFGPWMSNGHVRALIASWRERGEALKAMEASRDQWTTIAVQRGLELEARAALKDKA